MVNFAREVFVCVCPTRVQTKESSPDGAAAKLVFRRGNESDIGRLNPDDHSDEYKAQLVERFENHYWLLGELNGEIATYTWLHQKDEAEYRFLPGCKIAMDPSCGYGFDAWTPPKLRGQGLRRVAFLEELKVLSEMGCDYEASFFVKHQLEGATRSLGLVGIEIIPLWRVSVQRDKSFKAECINQDLAHVARPSLG